MSDYRCEACGKYRKPEKREFAVGDKVKFATTVSYPSGRMRTTSREGEVLGRFVGEGGPVLRVKVLRVKVPMSVREAHCLPPDAPDPLTYVMFGVCGCGGAQ